ncbi:sterol 3-beta-glucosyltransferase UGT80A2-like isoform X2 [Aristolochia californica]|uniref:sterol 3-beta-glucosyltransferase UGT80A2-like isoform X2 n=1 Tax=Aristolochia californica TaxID=171875 RepID=UPI0035D96E48
MALEQGREERSRDLDPDSNGPRRPVDMSRSADGRKEEGNDSSGEVTVSFEVEIVDGGGGELRTGETGASMNDGEESEESLNNEAGSRDSSEVDASAISGQSSGKNDRSLPRANTLPGEIANTDNSESSAGLSNLERSKTERRKQNDTTSLFDDKISDRQKLKMLKRIATVTRDGAVAVELPGRVESESLQVGPEDIHSEAVDEELLDLPDIQYIPPLQIVMLIVGTRGDVQPFIAIGKRLQDYGHRVRLATHSNFKEFVLTAGLEFYPLGGDPKVLAEWHTHVAEALKVPLHIFFTMPWTPTSQFPHPLSRVKQPAGYRLSYQIVDSLIWLGIRDMINEFRKKKLKLRPVTYLSGAQGSAADVPYGYIWSPHLVPKPKDWGPKIDVVGFCFLDLASNYEPPEDLVKWLKAGDKPIYIGFGSLPVQEPEKMTQIIVEALESTQQRGIINKGWGGLGNLATPKDFVYSLDNCPHDWLFLHCKAVVHHGGAGTTAAGLKAACPTTIVPFFGDQPFWGDRVHARGVGPAPIPVDQFSLPKLVDAIKFMLDPKVKDRALELAKAMESEDGVTGAVKAFLKQLPRKMPQPQPSPMPSGLFEPCLGSVKICFGCS